MSEEIKKFLDQFNLRRISKLIKDISRVLPKLLKHFHVILTLDLNDLEFFVTAAGLSL